MLIAAKNMHHVLALNALLSLEFDMKDLGSNLGKQNHFKLSIEQSPRQIVRLKIWQKCHMPVQSCCLMYAMVCTRPDLAYVVSQVCKYMSKLDLDDRRSTTRHVFTLREGPICWKSTVQFIVALSTTKAENIAVADAPKEAFSLAGYQRTLVLSKVEFSCTVTVKINLFG
ncbi:UNVERIFIED_CONTAM: Retrovirus-related Pol polyprotein from transposon TNT 1-94 [Sesamum angustifolium]|uniref:Retrovirus-related Pol polyprotein from transposon TNT 1-94 n=1 Tax=Sesamum angustifolium TaxID=2727405 RepID=A0AAW2JMS3_9LAMI